jgi:hypothetical protein
VELDNIPPLADMDSVAGLTKRIEPVSLLFIYVGEGRTDIIGDSSSIWCGARGMRRERRVYLGRYCGTTLSS